MRLLVTSDLHFDHGRASPGSGLSEIAERAVDEINRLSFDVLLVVGDTATARGDTLERALARFSHRGPRLLTLGNHELWSAADEQPDTLHLYTDVLPRRVAGAGWHCLDASPFRVGEVAFVGTVGWYDYAFAPEHLRIPRRFYEAKVSPGAAAYYTAYNHLLTPSDDVPPETLEIYARWNDARHIRWPVAPDAAQATRRAFDDLAFCELQLARLGAQLEASSDAGRIVAAVHHLPLRELLPPPSTNAFDFAKAFLGSPRFGELLSRHPKLTHVFTGHSHFPAATTQGPTHYLATGSGYRQKQWHLVEL